MKKDKIKMTRDIVPDDFTMTLAIVDAIPVLFFCLSMIQIGSGFPNPFFLIGAILVFFAGAVKVLWKIIVVLKKKNIWWMFMQMRILMPLGMVCMIISLIAGAGSIELSAIWSAVSSFPASICFGFGIAGMILMTVFAFKLDSSDLKSNWIEQITNGIAQVFIFLGVLFVVL